MKLDRLIGIITVLLQNERVTAPQLAERFEVSRRTIGRDIDALCQAGIPVVTYQGGGGGIAIAEGYKLDKSVLTREELSDMIAALKGLGSVTGKSQIERMLDKLSVKSDAVVSLRESVVIDLASNFQWSLTEKIRLIKMAVAARQLIEFDYYYDKGLSHRRIEPYFLVFQWSAWYVFGYCTHRQDWRLFKLARLWELTLCENSFVPREIPPEKLDFKGNMFDEKKVVALFDPSVKYLLAESYGLDALAETADGRLRLELGYSNRAFILNWLLSFGDKVTVVEPADLGEQIKAIAEKMIENYK
jgi:predicted DNA-binding transcriptional regulator YafY